jgi:hypothetical protein
MWTPSWTKASCHLSEGIEVNIFTHWFIYFITLDRQNVYDAIALVFDHHFSHTRSSMLWIFQGKRISIPYHITQRVQLFDVQSTVPFKQYYALEFEQWLENHSLRAIILTITQYFFGLCPSSGILETIKHNVSETTSVSFLRWIERHLLC